MANDVGKPGLSTFGWLLLGGAAYAVLRNPERRDKLLQSVKGLTGKLSPSQGGGTAGSITGTDTTKTNA